jgi:hypothetical protein
MVEGSFKAAHLDVCTSEVMPHPGESFERHLAYREERNKTKAVAFSF